VSSLTAQFGSVELSSNSHCCFILASSASMSVSNLSIETTLLLDEGLDCRRVWFSSKLMEGEGKGLCWCQSLLSLGLSAVAVEEI